LLIGRWFGDFYGNGAEFYETSLAGVLGAGKSRFSTVNSGVGSSGGIAC
jgi:hypothetical protein